MDATQQNPDAPRPLIDGRYRVIAPIGAGGFGEVQLVEDTLRKGRRYALKSILPEHSSSPEFEQRFHREIDVLRALQHPSIPQIVNDGRADDGAFYFTMEFVNGRPLGELIRDEGPLKPLRLARLVRELSRTLAYAHSRGVVHRDLKPSNILIEDPGGPEERLHVLDFGIAKLLDPKGPAEEAVDVTMQTAGFIGTPEYASPEQVLGESVDARTDLYALGILIHFLATGKYPFAGKSRQEIATKRLHTPPIPLAKNEAPGELRSLVRSLLERDRDKRPESDAIIAALDSVLHQLSDERQSHALSLRWAAGAATLIAGAALAIPLLRANTEGGEPGQETTAAAAPEATESSQKATPATTPATTGGGAPGTAGEDATPSAEEPIPAASSSAESQGPATEGPVEDPVEGPAEDPVKDSVEGPLEDSAEPSLEVEEEERPALDLSDRPRRPAAIVEDAQPETAQESPSEAAAEEPVAADPTPPPAPAVTPRLPRGARLPDGFDPAKDLLGDLPTRLLIGDPAIEIILVTEGNAALVYLGACEISRDQLAQRPSDRLEGGGLPATDVSFEEAAAFAETLDARLPSQSEWLAGASPAPGQAFPWGEDFDASRCRVSAPGVEGPVPTRDPAFGTGRSWCGLWHTVGNVAEWVTEAGKPLPVGGSYRSRPDRCRLVTQKPRGITSARPDVGFRLAVDLPH